MDGNTPVTSTLDLAGRTTGIAEGMGGSGPYTTTYGYTPNSLPISASFPNGAGATLGYDAASRIRHVGLSGPAGAPSPLSSGYDYGYDAQGRTTGMTRTVNGAVSGQALTHDAFSRLTSLQSGGTTQSWGYDGNGNITQTVTNGAATLYGYDNASAPNELRTLTVPGQATRYYGYDTNGDTTSITDGATTNTRLSYDSRARLSGVTLADGTSVSMRYNASGQRARYTVSKGGVTSLDERFSYRGGELGQMAVVSATATGTTSYTDTYIYDPSGQPLELLRQQGGGLRRYWYGEDGKGNVVALTDSAGNAVDRYTYDAWGQPTATSEGIQQPFRYAGYVYDQALGWYWLSVRAYDPGVERFVQPDPSGADGVRTYAYVGDDPTDATDPTGLDGVAGLPGDSDLNFVLVGGAVLLVIAIAPYAVPVALTVGTAVVIGAVVYKVSRIQFGRTRTPTMIAYLPRPGSVQASPIAGGTTLTTPGQVQITLPTYHAATGVAGEIESLDGKSRSEADALLCSRGATRSVTAGGYTHYKFPDKSQVVIGPDGRVIRTPAPEYGPNGERTNKGHRLDQNGQPTTSHDTGERLRD